MPFSFCQIIMSRLGETQNLKLDENTTVLKCQSGIISIRYHAKCRHFKKGASNNLVPRALRVRSSHSSGPWGRGYAYRPKNEDPPVFLLYHPAKSPNFVKPSHTVKETN